MQQLKNDKNSNYDGKNIFNTRVTAISLLDLIAESGAT